MDSNSSSNLITNRITVAYGDGIGPEIMNATLSILEAAKVNLEMDRIKIGREVYLQGGKTGIPDEAWDILRKNKVFFKAPITTPQGGGYKSLNVTIRKSLGMFANVRPVRAYMPFIKSHFPSMDVVVVRENEEDLYAGIEHRQSSEMVQCLKLISRPGSERVIRYAFEYAKTYGRKKVTCLTKDNIMKLTDGMFHRLFNQIAEEYPDIESDHYIIDIGSALLADRPERFDVVVTLNLYGDIISDITAQVSGSVGLGGSANIGDGYAMFEAIHGSAPDIAGRGIANPSGLINASCMMLAHLGLMKEAALIQNALITTLEDGIHTGDIFNDEFTVRRVGTEDFAKAVIERLGLEPKRLKKVSLNPDAKPIRIPVPEKVVSSKRLVGVDVFLDWDKDGRDANVLGRQLEEMSQNILQLKGISNRGVRVYPDGLPEIFHSDHWRCRFMPGEEGADVSYNTVNALLARLVETGFDFIKVENLYEFDGKRGYSL